MGRLTRIFGTTAALLTLFVATSSAAPSGESAPGPKPVAKAVESAKGGAGGAVDTPAAQFELRAMALRAMTREAERLIGQGQLTAALKEARRLEAALARLAPLELFDGSLVRAPAEGVGLYEAAPDGEVRGPEIFLYAGVRNFGMRELGGGYELSLVSDLVVLDEDGAELARDVGFGRSQFVAKTPQRETFVNVGVASKGLPAGSYVMRLVVRDLVSGKSGQIDIPVRVPRQR